MIIEHNCAEWALIISWFVHGVLGVDRCDDIFIRAMLREMYFQRGPRGLACFYEDEVVAQRNYRHWTIPVARLPAASRPCESILYK